MRYFEGHDGTITSLAFAPDGLTFASVATRGPALLWDLGGMEAPQAFPDPGSSVVLEGLTRIAWSQQPNVAAVGTDHGDVYVFSTEPIRVIAKIESNIVAPVTGLAFFNNGRYVVISCGGVEDGAGAIYVADREKQFRRSTGS